MRKQHSAAFKAQIVLEALKEIKTVAQIASEHQLHPNLVTKWKQEGSPPALPAIRPGPMSGLPLYPAA